MLLRSANLRLVASLSQRDFHCVRNARCNPPPTAQVIKLISQVIADFADGEIRQMGRIFDTDLTMEDYMDKSFYKTASLIAASCRRVSVFAAPMRTFPRKSCRALSCLQLLPYPWDGSPRLNTPVIKSAT